MRCMRGVNREGIRSRVAVFTHVEGSGGSFALPANEPREARCNIRLSFQ